MSDLDQISVPVPCKASWEAMKGSDRVRFCASCAKNVYDISAMTRPEAEALVFGAKGRVCARFHRRPDGRVLTSDCREGRDALRGARARRRARVAAALLAVLSTLGATGCGVPQSGVLRHSRARQWPVVGALLEWLDPMPMVAGMLVMPPPAPPRPPGALQGEVGDPVDEGPDTELMGDVYCPPEKPPEAPPAKMGEVHAPPPRDPAPAPVPAPGW